MYHLHLDAPLIELGISIIMKNYFVDRALPCRVLLAALAVSPLVSAQEGGIDVTLMPTAETLNDAAFPQRSYSPYAGRNFPSWPLFGDTHLHTSYSMDAGAFGARLTPEDAYRFAKGEEITASTGQRVKLSRPLDFLVVADHSDNLGVFPALFAGDPTMLANDAGRRWYEMITSGEGAKAAVEIIVAASQGTFPQEMICTWMHHSSNWGFPSS